MWPSYIRRQTNTLTLIPTASFSTEASPAQRVEDDLTQMTADLMLSSEPPHPRLQKKKKKKRQEGTKDAYKECLITLKTGLYTSWFPLGSNYTTHMFT